MSDTSWYKPNTGKMHQSFFEMPIKQTEQERKELEKIKAIAKEKGADDGK